MLQTWTQVSQRQLLSDCVPNTCSFPELLVKLACAYEQAASEITAWGRRRRRRARARVLFSLGLFSVESTVIKSSCFKNYVIRRNTLNTKSCFCHSVTMSSTQIAWLSEPCSWHLWIGVVLCCWFDNLHILLCSSFISLVAICKSTIHSLMNIVSSKVSCEKYTHTVYTHTDIKSETQYTDAQKEICTNIHTYWHKKKPCLIRLTSDITHCV